MGRPVSLVTVGGVVGTQLGVFTFDAVALTSIAPSNTASSDGSSLTLFGINFGTVDVTASAAIGGSSCGTASWSSLSSIRCLPAQSSTGRSLVGTVTVGNAVGTALYAFSIDAPVVTLADPVNSALSEVAWLSISGTNFGQVDATASAAIGSLGCGTVSWSTGTAMMCYAGSSMGDTTLRLAVAGSVGTMGALFSFDGESRASDSALCRA